MALLLTGGLGGRAAGQPCILTETAKLTAPDAEPSHFFGTALAIEGEVLVIGALLDDDGGSDVGAVYVYRFNGETWAFETKLFPTDASDGARFGSDVSTDGEVIVVGAYNDEGIGSAYVYRFDGLQWIQEVKLVPSEPLLVDCFGFSVAVRGSHLIVGNPCDRLGDIFCPSAGSAQPYRYSTGWQTWGKKLTAPVPTCGDRFGCSVGINRDSTGGPKSYDLIAVGAPGVPDKTTGAVHVFTGPQLGWGLVSTLTPFLPIGASFGSSLAIREELLAVGALFSPDLPVHAYVNIFGAAATLLPADLPGFAAFGSCLAVEQDTIVAGAFFESSLTGAAYVFVLQDGMWKETAKLVASDAATGDQLGCGLAVSGSWVAMGAAGDDDGGSNSGSVYLYELDLSDGDNNGSPDVCECPADINGNGVVDVPDLADLLAVFGLSGLLPEDIDGSGQVDVLDLIALLLDFGQACPTGPLG